MFSQFLRQWSVRTRIVGGFAILLLFLTLSIPLIVTNHLDLAGRIQQVTNVDAKSDRLLLSSLSYILSSRVNLMRYADDVTPSTSEALADVKKAIQSVEEARVLIEDSAQKTSMANILAGLVSYNTLITNVQTARLENRQQDVATLLTNSYQLAFSLEQQITTVAKKNQNFMDESNSAALETARIRLVFLLALYVGLLILAAFIAFAVQKSIAQPVFELRQAAEIFRTERRALSIDVEGKDELSVLAQTFNQITSELGQVLSGLEQRVAERTRALATVSEIGMAASTILDIDILLQEVVDLSKERFGLYHAHIYLLDDAGENLALTSGAGDIGRQMVAEGRFIPLDRERSLVARAARERQGVTVNDVTLEPDFLPNPLLPDTHSELAVPMMVGERVIGVFDVQSEIVGRFTEADISVQTTLASQIASAVQNARSYTEVQNNQELLSDALRIAKLGNWEYNLEKDLFTFNDQFYAIFRTSVDEVGSYTISSAEYARRFVHPEDAALVGSEIQKTLESKERYYRVGLEHRTIFANGDTGYMTVNINVERDENGKIVRWYGANQDVTERRRAEESNRQRAQQQEALNTISQKIQGTTSIEDALKITARELGHILHAKTVVNLESTGLRADDKNIAGTVQNLS